MYIEQMDSIRQIDEARAPLIAKQLEEFKPKWESQNQDLSQTSRDAEWQKIHNAAYATSEGDLPLEVREMIEDV